MAVYIQASFTQQGYGQNTANVFFYKSDNATSQLQSVAFNDAFWNQTYTINLITTTIGGFLTNVQTNIMQNDFLITQNMFNPLDFETLNIGGTGALTGEALASNSALAYRTARVTREIRRGAKRICGLPEAYFANGIIETTGVYRDSVVNLATALGLTITGDDGTGTMINFTPVILKRFKYITPGGNTAYRLPITESEADSNHYEAAVWEFNERVASQDSRKRAPKYSTS